MCMMSCQRGVDMGTPPTRHTVPSIRWGAGAAVPADVDDRE